MGSKLAISSNDSLFDKTRLDITGISGGCFCCGQQIHVSFSNLDVLPIARIEDSYFQVLICDDCEVDVSYLEKIGFPKVSFDILCLIQDDLKDKLNKLVSYYGTYSAGDRLELVADLYQKAEKKIADMSRDYPKGDDDDFEGNNKKDS